MQRLGICLLAAMVVMLGQVLAGFAGEADKKVPVPSPEAQARAKKLIEELYKTEMDKAGNDPTAMARLANTFLQEARDTNDDPAGRYVLLNLAITYAAPVGDAATALQAIEEKAQHYVLSPGSVLQAKILALGSAARAISSSDAYQGIIDSALVLLEDALGEDDFPSSLKLLEVAENAARKLRSVPLVAGLRKRQDDVQKLEKEFARWKPFADKLAQNSEDPQANLEMGLYQAFLKGSWERGLPLLARGGNLQLKKLAALDLAEPREGSKQVDLASQWLEEAQNLKDMMKIQVLLRAYHWYQQALGDLDAKTRDAVQERLQKITEMLPIEYRIGDIAYEIKKCDGQGGPVYSAAFSPDSKKIISGGADGSLRLYDVRTGRELRRLDGHSGRVWTVAFSPDGRRVASGGFDGSVRLWDLATGREIRRFPGHADYVRSVVFSRDGLYILSGGDDNLIRLWSIETGKEVRSFPGHEHFVWSVALSRDGRRALSGSLDKTVCLWDVATGMKLKVLRGHEDTVLGVAFTPDGRRGLSGSSDKTLILWDLETGKDLSHCTGHTGYVQAVAVSPDGRRALSAGQDNTVRLWDLFTGKELRKLEGHQGQVWDVSFSCDGRLSLSSGQDGTIRIWSGTR